MPPACRIGAGDMVFELPFDIAQKARCAKAEQVGAQPIVAQFLFHQGQVNQRILGLGNAACGLVADLDPRRGLIGADGADHGERDGQRGVDAFLAGGGFDEIGACHHAHERGARDISERAKLARGQDRLDMCRAAGRAKCAHFIVKRLPVSGQHMAARDDDVDLGGPRLHAVLDLFHPQCKGRQARRKPG